MEFDIAIMEDYAFSAIFASINKSAALDLSKDFVTKILGIRFLSLAENANHAKAEQRPKYCEHIFQPANNSF
jgi:hypothetical protein